MAAVQEGEEWDDDMFGNPEVDTTETGVQPEEGKSKQKVKAKGKAKAKAKAQVAEEASCNCPHCDEHTHTHTHPLPGASSPTSWCSRAWAAV